MKSLLSIIFVFVSVLSFAQDIVLVRTTIGAAGNSVATGYSKSLSLNSTVGQASPIGQINKRGIVLLQGFQQPLLHGQSVARRSLGTMKVFPVPSNGHITISWSESDIEETVNLSVFTIDGKIAAKIPCERKSGQIQADLSMLSKSHYFLVVRGRESGTSSARIILK